MRAEHHSKKNSLRSSCEILPCTPNRVRSRNMSRPHGTGARIVSVSFVSILFIRVQPFEMHNILGSQRYNLMVSNRQDVLVRQPILRQSRAVRRNEVAGDDNIRTSWTTSDIVDSEWRIGIQWFDYDGKAKGIGEPTVTWFRLKENFEVEWGFNARGIWNLDGQYLSRTREFMFGWGGKRIFSCKLSQGQNEVGKKCQGF